MKVPILALILAATSLSAAPIFDGKSLDGWEIRKGEEKWWRVDQATITGGSLTENVPHNTFLTSTKRYANFELRFKIKLEKGEGFINSGLQIRSIRVPDNHEMSGYQVDAGIGWWGKLYDESRRNKVLTDSIDPAAIATVAKDWDWNDYRILCEGRRIRSWINGVPALDYTEADPAIPQEGLIGLQAHSGGKFLVRFKDITLEELPPTPDLPTWPMEKKESPLTPEEQRTGFTVPDGFSVELVASEEQGVNKPITVAWDRHGRMWTMTATEYPVDANENQAAAQELYARGGKDRVLIFENPSQSGPLTPKLFADGLAIPLGIQPLHDGALVQHGSQIRHYKDTNNDGKADTHTVVLEGFGIQDSHLFPHQFERTPGGWIYVAQGLFNYSTVHRPGRIPFADGSIEIPFNQCKLARFKPDGSAFEILTRGPNNIWGLVPARTGETFAQEANDLGIPIAECIPGVHYASGARDLLRDDAPQIPPSTPNQPFGGTGLSGLALAEDLDSPFARGHDGDVFYVVNPITSRIQIGTMTRDPAGRPVFKKGPDFMTSDDPWFRPIAAHFGPDGCLYIVDWYNKIISHNEVPRAHPERDKNRGRIWRIRANGTKPAPLIDLAKATPTDLLTHLGAANARTARMAWHEIVDRKTAVKPTQLTPIIADETKPLPMRLNALWALEGLGSHPADLLTRLAQSKHPELRVEAIRIAGENALPEAGFLQIANALSNEKHYRVRAAIANSLRSHPTATPAMITHAAKLGLAPLQGEDRDAYDRNFERYLARWAMAKHLDATRTMLTQAKLEPEANLLAIRALPDPEAAVAMVRILPNLDRPLTPPELAVLGSQISQPPVQQGFAELLTDPARREPMLRAMLLLDPKVAAIPELAKPVETAARALITGTSNPSRDELFLAITRRFRLTPLAPEVTRWINQPARKPQQIATALATLREINGGSLAIYQPLLDHPDPTVKREATLGFSRLEDPATIAEFAKRWPSLTGADRTLAIDGMTSSPAKAEALAKAIQAGNFSGYDTSLVEKLITSLGIDHPQVAALMKSNENLLRPVIHLDGNPAGRVITNLTLEGPFTLETWIRLEDGIDNADNLFGTKGGLDINFYDARLRVWGGPNIGDLITANRQLKPNVWTHCAITRDADGNFAIYLDGELDQNQGKPLKATLTGLNLGESNPAPGTAASYDECRIWNIARSPEDIRRDHLTRYAGAEKPPGLIRIIHGGNPDGKLEGGAKITLTRDFPTLMPVAEAAKLEEKFARFRAMATKPGNIADGAKIAETTCLICHQVNGKGIAIGPNLSGAGAMGTEALLRNILTPNAQLESGYYRHDLKLTDGTTLSGFLASENPESLVLRQIGADERVIPRNQIASHQISKQSLMPEGLIDASSPQQVADLFAYLNSLK